ncbi:MAG TPA: 2-oxoacid:acceptor oxidoreductase family protein [Acidimicrobiales bacterium]|nr:2-oxoacid:acceptor oxidoreductase family protein [Acidimicrobiales bacterium]
MEREILLTGIGGQGVQLAARTLGLAVMAEDREVMVFGTYGGSMRGGNSDVTVIVADEPIRTPPTVAGAWAGLVMHHYSWPGVSALLRPGSVVVLDTSVFRGDLGRDDLLVLGLEASTMAIDLGNPHAGSQVALGAFAAATGVVSLEALVGATERALPPYRSQHIAANAEAVRKGFESVSSRLTGAWEPSKESVTP